LNCARKQNIPVLIDADGLYILSCETSLVKGLKKCILTPNMMEFKRIYESEVLFSFFTSIISLKIMMKQNFKKFKNEEEYDETKSHSTIELQCQAVKKLAQKLEYITIVKKGYVDIISDGHELILNEAEGMPKRCGGIGDLLSGTIGTFSYWCDKMISENRELKNSIQNSNMIACYASGVFIKECSKRAFSKFRRSVLAVDIIEQIADVFFEMFDK
jgi:ATP-dependent NAD(P)H-hydrate dehydratase